MEGASSSRPRKRVRGNGAASLQGVTIYSSFYRLVYLCDAHGRVFLPIIRMVFCLLFSVYHSLFDYDVPISN